MLAALTFFLGALALLVDCLGGLAATVAHFEAELPVGVLVGPGAGGTEVARGNWPPKSILAGAVLQSGWV